MKINRQLHLWIGLITSFFILIESITGLVLMEPWLVGGKGQMQRPAVVQQAASGTSANGQNAPSAPTAGSAQGKSKAGESAVAVNAASGDPQASAASTGASAAAAASTTAVGSTAASGNGAAASAAAGTPAAFGKEGGQAGNSLYGLIKGLHEGRIGQTNIKWVMDLTAIGMIVLTVTGIVMSLKILKAQAKGRKKRASAAMQPAVK